MQHDHSEEVYQLIKDHQSDIRDFAKKGKLIQLALQTNGIPQPTTTREWLAAFAQLRKISVEISLVVQEPQAEAGC
jgi:sulfatase maturation enzyme AslB (radical SAM superfamily)